MSKNIHYSLLILFKGAYHFGLGVGGEGQDTSRHFDGSFGSICAILPIM